MKTASSLSNTSRLLSIFNHLIIYGLVTTLSIGLYDFLCHNGIFANDNYYSDPLSIVQYLFNIPTGRVVVVGLATASVLSALRLAFLLAKRKIYQWIIKQHNNSDKS